MWRLASYRTAHLIMFPELHNVVFIKLTQLACLHYRLASYMYSIRWTASYIDIASCSSTTLPNSPSRVFIFFLDKSVRFCTVDLHFL